MSRLITDLIPECQELYKRFKLVMDMQGLTYVLTCTYRSQEEQDVLYEQGRTKPGKIVTWTHNSRHTSRRAFDIAITKDGKACWDVKVDVDQDQIPDYQEAGEIGESVGLVWGGRWKKPDYPHFELPKEVAV